MKRKYTDEQLILSVKNNSSLQKVLDDLHLIGGHTRIKQKIIDLKLDVKHWKNFSGTTIRKIQPIQDLLSNNTSIQTSNLKLRLLKNNLLKYKCAECNLSEWRGKVLSLQLDHIDGIRTNNQLGNLRLLCPNCHSQTDTYCGRNVKGIKRKKNEDYVRYECVKCKKMLLRHTNKLKMCNNCRKEEYGGKLLPQQLFQFYQDYDSKKFSINEICVNYDITSTTLYNLLKRRSR